MNPSVRQLQEKDYGVFKDLYDVYHTKLYHFVFKHTQSVFITEETVQLTFIKIWENADRLSREVDLSAQIFRIAKCTMIDLLRQEYNRQQHHSQLTVESVVPEEAQRLEGKLKLRQVFETMEDMPPVRKKVFTLSRVEGHSHYVIAKQLKISPKTVEHHITKAIRQLRNSITSFLF